MVTTAGAVALEAGIAVDLTGVESCEVPDTVGVTGTVRVAVAVAAGEATGLVAVGLGDVAVTAGDAWPSGGAVD